MTSPSWRALLAAAVITTGLACDSHSPNPERPSPISSLEEADLTQRLEQELLREQTRVEAEAQASQAVHDSLIAEWEQSGGATRPADPEGSGPLPCAPLEYAADVKVVGPEGATLTVGPHELSIPPGALKRYVVITAEMPVEEAATVRLSPRGLLFALPATLTMSYRHCLETDRGKRVAYTDEDLNPIELPPSQDWRSRFLVESWIDHFSRYAIWY